MHRPLKLAAFLLGTSLALGAQSASILREGSFEVGMLAGDTIGGLVPADIPLADFTGFRVKSPGKGTLAISVAIAESPKLLFYGQFGAFKGEHRDRPLTSGFSAATNLLNLVYEGGFERIFATKWSRVAFYALGGGSTIQKRVDAIVNFVNPNPSPLPTDVLGGATRVRLKKAVFAPVVGSGVRYYFGRRFGFRIEGKAYFPTGDVPRPTGVANAGLFVDFP